jgi:hypothetical protein
MKQYKIIVLVVLMLALFGAQDLFAYKRKPDLPDHYLTFSFVIHPASVGYKHRVASSTYLTTNLDFVGGEHDLYFQVGASYLIPHKFWIFWFYGGTGLQFSRKRAYQYPYITLGTRFWILYSEVVYPIQRAGDTGFRFGFSVTF